MPHGRAAGSLLMSTGGGVAQFQVLHAASTNRWIAVTGSNGGNPTISTTGYADSMGHPSAQGHQAVAGIWYPAVSPYLH